MPRLAAFIVLAGIVASLRPAQPTAARPAQTQARVMTPAECRLLFMRSPSKSVH